MQQSDASSSASSRSASSISSNMLAGLRAQDEQAWSRLVGLFGEPLYFVCRDRGLQPHDAEDVVQEVFSAVARNVATFQRSQPGQSFRGWFWTIAHSKILDHYRREGRQPAAGGSDARERVENVAAADPSASDTRVAWEADRLLLERLIAMVRRDFGELAYECFRRMALDGKTSTQVAEELNRQRNLARPLTKDAVRQSKCRFLRRLREECAAWGLGVPQDR